MNNGKDFESLIEQIYRSLDPTSIIVKNDKIWGFESQQNREIDVSIKGKIGIHSLLIIIQARDYNKPIDINDIGEFSAVIKDVKANKGILISRKGFTKGALRLAKSIGIEVLTAHDTCNPKWKLKLHVPIILNTYEGNFNMDFVFMANDDYVEKVANKNRKIELPKDFQYIFTSDKGRTFIIPINEFKECYFKNKLIMDGKENVMDFTTPNIELVVEDELFVPAQEVTIKYSMVKKQCYKYFELSEFKGLINQLTNEVNPAHFKISSNEFTIENYGITNLNSFSFEHWKILKDTEKLSEPFIINLYHLPKLEQKTNTRIERIL